MMMPLIPAFGNLKEHLMERGNLSRRGFLQRSLAGLAVGAGLPLWFAREVLAEKEASAGRVQRRIGPNDRIQIGAIGIGSPGGRNEQLMHDVLGLKRQIHYVAVCDVDGRHRDHAAAMLKQHGMDVQKYKDFRELLDRKDIEAVLIATPDHWHTLVALEAMRKGKDVYCEKPLTLTIDEGKPLVKMAREKETVFQVGSQQRSDARFRLACELVRNGRIGTIKTVETRIGTAPTSPPIPSVTPPKELDWDFWLGPTPMVDYMELKKDKGTYTRCHYEFRWWYEYSGGKMTDWGAHHNDIAQWGLGMDGTGPIAVEAEGKAPPTTNNQYNVHEQFKVTYTYANGAKVVCAHAQLPGAPDPKETKITRKDGREKAVGHDNGILFIGESGQWIFVNREIIAASDKKLLEEPLSGNAQRLEVSNNHMGNFFDCLSTRKRPICDVEIGHRSVTVCHLGVIALRSGMKLKWNPKDERFEDSEANKWLSREMRAPWKIEV
jgi:predicted dehydrogenase